MGIYYIYLFFFFKGKKRWSNFKSRKGFSHSDNSNTDKRICSNFITLQLRRGMKNGSLKRENPTFQGLVSEKSSLKMRVSPAILIRPSPSLRPLGHQPWKSATNQTQNMPPSPGTQNQSIRMTTNFYFTLQRDASRWDGKIWGTNQLSGRRRHFHRISWRSGKTAKSKHSCHNFVSCVEVDKMLTQHLKSYAKLKWLNA